MAYNIHYVKNMNIFFEITNLNLNIFYFYRYDNEIMKLHQFENFNSRLNQ